MSIPQTCIWKLPAEAKQYFQTMYDRLTSPS